MTSIEFLEAMDASIEVLVLMHNGLLKFGCRGCPEELQEEFRCAFTPHFSDATDSVVFLPETETEYSCCPISMIPDCVYAMFRRKQFVDRFPHTVTAGTIPNLLWWFIRRYDHFECKHSPKPTRNPLGG